MAGMAWTLHPALFYEKYGTVLVQLWDSGALGTLFWPLRRLSKTIGEVVAAGLSQLPRVSDSSKSDVESSRVLLMDDDEITEDEASTKANRGPGDTSPDPSTSEENELAFQGDLYTRLRRNRRQQERIKKIRESRKQFMGGDDSSTSDTGSRKKQRRRGSVMPRSNKALRKEFGQTGTPLTDMTGTAPLRAVVMDVSDVTASSGPSEDEEAGEGVGGVQKITPGELLADNDSLRKFRAISGQRKKARASPPPEVLQRSDTASDTGSCASDTNAGSAVGGIPPKSAQAPISFVLSPFVETAASTKADPHDLEMSPTTPASIESPELPFSNVRGKTSLTSPEKIGSKSDDPKITEYEAMKSYEANAKSSSELTPDLAEERAKEDRSNTSVLAVEASAGSEEKISTGEGVEISPAMPRNSKEEGQPEEARAGSEEKCILTGEGVKISPVMPCNSKEEGRPEGALGSTVKQAGFKALEVSDSTHSDYPNCAESPQRDRNIDHGGRVNIKSKNEATRLAPVDQRPTDIGADMDGNQQGPIVTLSASDTFVANEEQLEDYVKPKARKAGKESFVEGSESPSNKIFPVPTADVVSKGSVGEHGTATLSSETFKQHEEAGENHAGAGGLQEICSKPAHKIAHKHEKHHHKKHRRKIPIVDKPEPVTSAEPSGFAAAVPNVNTAPSEPSADKGDTAVLEASPRRHRHTKKHKKHAKHGRKRSSTETKRKEGKKAACAQTTSPGPTSGDDPSGSKAEGTAELPVDGAPLDGAENTSRFIKLLPSMDTTMSGTNGSVGHSDPEHHNQNTAVIEGNNVTVHLDVSSAHKKPRHWPFFSRKDPK